MKSSGILVIMLLVATMDGCASFSRATKPIPFVPNGPLQSENVCDDFVVKTYKSDSGSFEILKKGLRVYAGEGDSFFVNRDCRVTTEGNAIPYGTDLTGTGQPYLLVAEWTGGAHCCSLLHLFQLGPKFRFVQTIDAQHSDANFINADSDPALEIRMRDWTFAYWRTSFAASPAPEVILKYQGITYRMAPSLMRKPGLSPDELEQLSTEIRSLKEWTDEKPPVRMWGEMLRLIYTGNMEQAWQLLEMSWSPERGGKLEFLKAFRDQLKESPFWKEIKELNPGAT